MTNWFSLPLDLAAHSPPESRGLGRDEVRLLVTFREKDHLAHATFRELPDFLRRDDLLVVNDSATLPAALTARRANGTELPLHLSTHRYPNRWVVEPRRIAPSPGETLSLPGDASATVLTPYRDSHRLWLARLDLPTDDLTYLSQHGRPIAYDYVKDRFPLSAYQTIFARVPGSAEMPSAGRPFTSRLLAALRRKGVHIATITLHTGVASLEGHESPYEEWFEVPATTAESVRRTIAQGGRVIAVGTTVVRALESSIGLDGTLTAKSGWTDLLVTPERGIRVVHGLLTGFHEPAATHLQMLEAIAGASHIRRSYRAALDHRYLWHEFGDVHLIL